MYRGVDIACGQAWQSNLGISQPPHGDGGNDHNSPTKEPEQSGSFDFPPGFIITPLLPMFFQSMSMTSNLAVTAPQTEQPQQKPITPQERIKAAAIAVAFIALGAGMWKWHDLYVSDLLSFVGGQPHTFRLKIDWIWCRPTGAVLIFVGAVALLGCLTKRSATERKPTA
jgi:hypothetical protein